jgi:undecaprenyl diphosphate synthase
VAIIMDGNGRWAQERGLSRIEGHRAATDAIRSVIEACPPLGVEVLTLYTFSVENWRRPKHEIEALMVLIEESLRLEIDELNDKGVSVRAIGRVHELPASLQAELKRSREMTRDNRWLRLYLALNYGGRAEIVDSISAIARKVAQGEVRAEDVTEEMVANHLYDPEMPDPDLLIRTAGEMRISNYLLWQIAYSEIWVTPVLWPDFRGEHLEQAVRDYQKRTRKFGGLTEYG